MKKLLVICLLIVGFTLFGNENQASAASPYGVIDQNTKSTIVPVRHVADTFHAKVKWNSSKKTVTINSEFVLKIGSTNVYKDDKVYMKLASKPKTINGTVYIPLRDIAKLLNQQIKWDQKNKQVLYTVDGVAYQLPTHPEKTVKNPKYKNEVKTFKVNGKSIKATIVRINLLAPNTAVDVQLAQNTLGKTDKLATIAKNNGAKVAINANYFDAYTNTSGLRMVYNGIIMDGKKVRLFDHKMPVFYTDLNGHAAILPGKAVLDLEAQGLVAEAVQIGPTLMRNGEISLNPAAEGSRDPKILTLSATRSAVAILPNQQVVFMTVPSAKMTELAQMMKQLGAVDAMNFDGGASTGLFMNGKYLTSPGRDIAVGLLIK